MYVTHNSVIELQVSKGVWYSIVVQTQHNVLTSKYAAQGKY